MVHGQNVGGQKILGDKMSVKILWDREGKMPILTKHFIYETDG